MENQGDLKLCASSTDIVKRFAVIKSVVETRGIILSRQRITKTPIRLQMRRLICIFVIRIWHKQVQIEGKRNIYT